MKLDNVQTLMDFLMKNADKLSASKISAFAQVMGQVKDYTPLEKSPNQDFAPSDPTISEDTPLDLPGISSIQIEGGKPQEVKIYKS